jgi:hypothetical protein
MCVSPQGQHAAFQHHRVSRRRGRNCGNQAEEYPTDHDQRLEIDVTRELSPLLTTLMTPEANTFPWNRAE